MEVGSREARLYILTRLLDDSTKRDIVDEHMSAYGWEDQQAWDEVRLVEEMLSAARAHATYGGEERAPHIGGGAVALLIEAI